MYKKAFLILDKSNLNKSIFSEASMKNLLYLIIPIISISQSIGETAHKNLLRGIDKIEITDYKGLIADLIKAIELDGKIQLVSQSFVIEVETFTTGSCKT